MEQKKVDEDVKYFLRLFVKAFNSDLEKYLDEIGANVEKATKSDRKNNSTIGLHKGDFKPQKLTSELSVALKSKSKFPIVRRRIGSEDEGYKTDEEMKLVLLRKFAKRLKSNLTKCLEESSTNGNRNESKESIPIIDYNSSNMKENIINEREGGQFKLEKELVKPTPSDLADSGKDEAKGVTVLLKKSPVVVQQGVQTLPDNSLITFSRRSENESEPMNLSKGVPNLEYNEYPSEVQNTLPTSTHLYINETKGDCLGVIELAQRLQTLARQFKNQMDPCPLKL